MAKDIQFSVTVEEAELMLQALAQLPYVRVAQLIQKCNAQAQACLAPPPEESVP